MLTFASGLDGSPSMSTPSTALALPEVVAAGEDWNALAARTVVLDRIRLSSLLAGEEHNFPSLDVLIKWTAEQIEHLKEMAWTQFLDFEETDVPLDKKEIVDEIARLLGMPAPPMSTGSTEPRAIFQMVNDRLGLGLNPRMGKPELARGIARSQRSDLGPRLRVPRSHRHQARSPGRVGGSTFLPGVTRRPLVWPSLKQFRSKPDGVLLDFALPDPLDVPAK